MIRDVRSFGHPGCRLFLRTTDSPDVSAPISIADARRHGGSASIEVWYDTTLGERGAETAEVVLSRCEGDLATISDLFQGVRPSALPIRVVLARMPPGAPACHDSCDPSVAYCDVDMITGDPGPRVLSTCFLVATQLVEIVAAAQSAGWQGTTAHGEALSRVLAASLYPRWPADFATAANWLRSSRGDAVNTAVAGDSDREAIGCAALFLHYLHHELDFSWRHIIALGAPTLAVAYRRTTGTVVDPFPQFRDRLAAAFPPGAHVDLAGDNPFPSDPPADNTEHRSLSAATPAGAGPASPVTLEAPAVEAPAVPSVEQALAHRRWWVIDAPFCHVRAENVFTSEVYAALVESFRRRLSAGDLTSSLPGYDASAAPVTRENAGAFALFLTREWHDLVAGLFCIETSGDIIATLHHHAPCSASGILHNDLNPGWFPVPGSASIRIHDPALNNYRTGHSPNGAETIERTRAVAVLYYLDTAEDVQGGGTGLYRSAQQGVDHADVVVPPRNNSLVAFECTPFSFHTFLSNVNRDRNCLAMWLHRDTAEVVRRWGTESIVRWQ